MSNFDDLQLPLTQDNLIALVDRYHDDPRAFIEDMLVIPELDDWQIKVCEMLKEGKTRIAISSCNGSGKSFLTSALELWWLLCKPLASVSVCSATFSQLYEVHFRLIRSHINDSIIKNYYNTENSTKICLPNSRDEAVIRGVGNNAGRPESIQGQHHGSILGVFDEASGIHQDIYDAMEGNLTTEGATWIAIGNPLKSGTPFHKIFSDSRWEHIYIDARDCKYTSKLWVDQMIAQYGPDDDRVRARVFGQFPRGAINTVVSLSDYEDAENREIDTKGNPYEIVIGFDPSRSGADASVVCARQGRKLLDIKEMLCRRDSVDLAEEVLKYANQWNGTVICIDGTGLGGPIADMLRRRFKNVQEVVFGSGAMDKTHYLNKRAELWVKYANWLKTASIPKIARLKQDSTNIELWYTTTGKAQVEDKSEYKARGFDSCDYSDAVVCSLFVDGQPKMSAASNLSARAQEARIRQQSQGSVWG